MLSRNGNRFEIVNQIFISISIPKDNSKPVEIYKWYYEILNYSLSTLLSATAKQTERWLKDNVDCN